MKSAGKILFVIVLVIYLLLYFSYEKGYYINRNKEKSLLTEEMIKEYEDDLKKGIDVSEKEYLVPVDNYDNKYTRISLKISKHVEEAIDKAIKYLFNQVGNTINE